MISNDLKLVIPVRDDLYAYHVPISSEVFEANYRIIAATKAQLAGKGVYYQMDTGPRIAAMALRDEGRRDAELRGDFDETGKPKDAAHSLLTELKRLTTILGPTPAGWEPMPVDAAIHNGVLDPDEWQEALSAIVFFTCHYALAKKAQRSEVADAVAGILSASITASSVSEYASSLKKSTADGSSAAT